MSLRFVYGRSGSGKTDFLFSKIFETKRPSVIIVPEQYSFTAEERLSKTAGIHGPGGIEIFSFGRLAWRILSAHEGAAARHIDAAGKAMLIYKILSDNRRSLTALKKSVDEAGVPAELSKLIGEFKRYGQTPETLLAAASQKSDLLSQKLSDIALVYGEYEKAIEKNYIDNNDDMTRMAMAIEENKLFFDTDIYIDRFSSFTPSELLCIKSLMRTSPNITVALCMTPKDAKNPEFAPCGITAERLLFMAKEVGIGVEPAVVLSQPADTRSVELSHLEEEFFSYPAREYTEKCSNISVFAAQNPLTEVEFVARKILELCRDEGYMLRDIAIAGRDMGKYSKYIKTVFSECEIPCFLDLKANILNHPLVIFILSALETIVSNFSYEAVFTYAKSGFLRIPAEQVDKLENYVLATGIRGNVWKDDEKWSMRASVYSEREELTDDEADEVILSDKTRRKIALPLIKLENTLKESETAAEKCRALYEFMLERKLARRTMAMAKLFEKNGQTAESAQYRSVFNKIVDALDAMTDALGSDKISMRRFYEVLKSGLEQYEIGIIPMSADGVTAGDVSRIRGYHVRALFLVGANDGVFPASPPSGGLLNDSDRITLINSGFDMAPDFATQRIEEEHLVYKTLSMPSERIFVSYANAEFDGTASRPSQIVLRLFEVFPNIQFEDDLLGGAETDKLYSQNSAFYALVSALSERGTEGLSPAYKKVYNWFSSHPDWSRRLVLAEKYLNFKNRATPLSPKTAKLLWQDNLKTAVSRLETFSACPFSYFAKYTLSAKERRVISVGASDAGSFMHGFIDTFSKRLGENGQSWHSVDEAYIDGEIEKIMSAFDLRLNKYLLANSPRTARLFTRLCRVIKRSLLLIANSISCGEFYPLGYELVFSENGDFKPLTITLPNGGKITLTGKIDRADAWSHPDGQKTFVRIIDYKSGSKTFNIGDVFDGLSLQLAVYLTAVCENDNPLLHGTIKPAGMLYFRLDDPVVAASPSDSREEIEVQRTRALKLRGLVLSDTEIINKMDKNTSTSSDILPAKITSGGLPSGSVASEVQFDILKTHTKKLVTRLSKRLMEGETSVSPYKKGQEIPCTYCPYSDICGFDLSVPGCSYRRLADLKDARVWEILGGEKNKN